MVLQEMDQDDLPTYMPYHDEVKHLDPPCAELNDNLIGAEVNIPTEDGHMLGKIKKRKRDHETNLLIGSAHPNLILDTRIYEVNFGDGTYVDYSTNVLIENIMNSADDNGQTAMFIDEIVGHVFNQDAIPKGKG